MATFHPDRYSYAGTLSAFNPSDTFTNAATSAGINGAGGNIEAMWGAPQLGRWKWHDPNVHANLLVANNTRGCGSTPRRPCPAPILRRWSARAEAQGSNRTFYAHYRALGGRNGHFDVTGGGNHDWGTWAGQLGPMASDIAAALN